jgi:predicted transcriptional regulator
MSDNTAPALDSNTLLALTAKIVSAYASNAKLTPAELNDTIGAVSRALSKVSAASVEPEKKELEPAVPVKKSVTPEFIICLEDGKKLKMLKRHLMSTYKMTPAQYREKWNLPRDYPMVAPNYAATRSALAKKIGLGKAPTPAAKLAAKPAPAAAATKKPAARGRPAKKAAA